MAVQGIEIQDFLHFAGLATPSTASLQAGHRSPTSTSCSDDSPEHIHKASDELDGSTEQEQVVILDDQCIEPPKKRGRPRKEGDAKSRRRDRRAHLREQNRLNKIGSVPKIFLEWHTMAEQRKLRTSVPAAITVPKVPQCVVDPLGHRLVSGHVPMLTPEPTGTLPAVTVERLSTVC